LPVNLAEKAWQKFDRGRKRIFWEKKAKLRFFSKWLILRYAMREKNINHFKQLMAKPITS
jgi:hypothetical protein